MHVVMHPYAILSLLSALISLLALIAAWRRSLAGSWILSLLLVSMMLWSGLYSTRWMNLSEQAEIFCFNLMYIGVTALPTFFLLFVLEFTRNTAWLTRRVLLLLSIQPLVSLLIVWTNPFHQLYYVSINAILENDFLTGELIRGPWYFVNVVYSYVMIAVSMIVLGLNAVRSGPMYRHQYRLVLLGSLVPWVSSIYSEYRFESWGGLDLAPITFGLSGIIFVLAILRVRFLDLIPVARSYVIENMSDGILVVDTLNRIVDINPAMTHFLEKEIAFYMGRDASELFSAWAEEADLLWGLRETHVEMRLPQNPSRYVDIRMTPLYDQNRRLNGRLLVFREITERKQVEKRLRYVNDRLQSQLIEIGMLQSRLREQAIRDPLTNLFNRRYLEETLDRELARAAREEYSLCVIMIDLDHFKRINDTHGHEAGDHVLKALATALALESRRGDFACRYGGEEFVVVMPNINLETAYERAGNLRNVLNSLTIPYGYYHLSVTISMGIACFPVNGQSRESILRAADEAMYAAKEAGRDHILSYDQLKMAEEALDD
ncbi:MAG TPA: diguanylate cyclase [Anaerolineales bacterium]|nr:diguanylate cyclase [Anaerolineales bacterium]